MKEILPGAGRSTGAFPGTRPGSDGLLRAFEENLGAWGRLCTDDRYEEEPDSEAQIWSSLEAMIRVTGAAGCSITLLGENRELLWHAGPAGPARAVYSRETIIDPGCLGHDAIRSGMPQFVQSVARDPLHHDPIVVRENGFASAACFPLRARRGVMGVLALYFGRERSLSPAERDLGAALALSAALAVENALLVEESRRNCLNTVQSLVRSLEARDSDTSHHSLRVTQYATLLGEKLGLAFRERKALQFGAMLHDIGKIGIIGEILYKKGKLTDEEYSAMREHPVIGARIVEHIDFLREAIPAIRHHHEMYDGNGYPDGLAGEEIPLIARIVTVPDFYDALTSHRPYREAQPREVALRLVEQGRGTIFDPEIADLFLTIHAREGALLPS